MRIRHFIKHATCTCTSTVPAVTHTFDYGRNKLEQNLFLTHSKSTMRCIDLLFLCGVTAAFSPPSLYSHHHCAKPVEESRESFVAKMGVIAGAAFLPAMPMPAEARGRATLEQTYDRYTPRIITGGRFYGSDLRKLVEKNDWEGLYRATSDPPAKTKADRSKPDGGVADRAAQAGGFSDSRVLVAADLLAAAFSDSSITAKTKKMQDEVAIMRETVQGINAAAREALGKDGASGGLFGFGPKKSQTELSKTARDLYLKGGGAYNNYIFLVNAELPLSLAKLPYLK